MSIFLGIHKIPQGQVQEADIIEGYNKYKQAAQEKGLKPLGALYSIEQGFTYCQTEADSADEVRQAHRAVEFPLEDVVEVKQLA